MKASAIEFRLRMWIQIAIVFLGFWAPWLGTLDWDRRISTLAWLAMEISRMGIVSFRVAAPVVIVCGALAALLGAILRVWGAAYLGYGTVHHEEMQGGAVMAAGPFRYVRNPLYLGGWFMMLAICLLMTPTGALFVMVLVTIFYVRLILGEEAFLTAKLGEPYKEYLSAVPRLVAAPAQSVSPRPQTKPHWLIAILTEINPIGIFVALAFFSWSYDNLLMLECILAIFCAVDGGAGIDENSDSHRRVLDRCSGCAVRLPSVVSEGAAHCFWRGADCVCTSAAQVRTGPGLKRRDHGMRLSGTVEVCVAKAVGVLEPESEQAVNPDVIGPDERNRQSKVRMQKQRTKSQRRRRHVSVKRVVDARAPAGSGEIAKHGKIGRQPQGREKPPARSRARVEHRGEDGHREPFKAQKKENRRSARRCECKLLRRCRSCCHNSFDESYSHRSSKICCGAMP